MEEMSTEILKIVGFFETLSHGYSYSMNIYSINSPLIVP